MTRMTALQQAVLDVAKERFVGSFTQDELLPFAKAAGINEASLGPALSFLSSKHEKLKRSRAEGSRTIHYRFPSFACPPEHTDYGHKRVAARSKTDAPGLTLVLAGLGEVTVDEARQAYDQLKQVFG